MKLNSVDPISLKRRLDEGTALLIDIREPHEYAWEHIEGALLVPLSRFHAEDFGEHCDRVAVFYCRSGARTGFNARLLLSKGFREAYHLSGGILAWKAVGLPTKSTRARQAETVRKRFGWLF